MRTKDRNRTKGKSPQRMLTEFHNRCNQIIWNKTQVLNTSPTRSLRSRELLFTPSDTDAVTVDSRIPPQLQAPLDQDATSQKHRLILHRKQTCHVGPCQRQVGQMPPRGSSTRTRLTMCDQASARKSSQKTKQPRRRTSGLQPAIMPISSELSRTRCRAGAQ